MYPLPAAAAAAHSPTRHGRRRPITSLGSPGSYNACNLFANNFEQPVDFSAMARESCSKQRRQKENNCGSPNKKEGKYCMVYRIDLLLILWGFKLNTVCMLIQQQHMILWILVSVIDCGIE